MGGIKISSSGNQSKRIGFSPALLLSEYFLFILSYFIVILEGEVKE